MKPYGKLSIIHFSCKCCQMRSSPRADAKIELRKLIQEESYQENKCPVCGQIDSPDCAENC